MSESSTQKPAAKKPYPFWLGGELSISFDLFYYLCSKLRLEWMDQRCRCHYSGIDYTVSFLLSLWNTHTKSCFQSPLDLTKVRLQASGDKRMIESIKKTVNTAGASIPISHKMLPSINLVSDKQGLGGYSMAFLVPGCVRCRIRCVGSGHTMRARRC